MSVVARSREWLRVRPTAADALLAALVLIVTLLPFVIRRDGGETLDRTPLVGFVLVGACACLVLRRRQPWWVLAATVVVGLVGVVDTAGLTPAYVPACVALYTVAVSTATRPAVLAGVATAVLPVAVLLPLGGKGIVDSLVFGMTIWAGLATMTGIAVRNQRAVVSAAYERARMADATREEEAQRRVSEERLRIARELHDVVAHHVSVINVQSGLAGHLLRTDPDGAAEAIAYVREASQSVLREVPGLLGLLRTTEDVLDRAPAPRLADAGALVEDARRSGLGVTWRTTGTPAELSPGGNLAAYRVVQEALTNAARHGAGPVDLSVTYADASCTIEVRNHRRHRGGLEEAGDASRLGLVGMAERVAAVGGELTAGPVGDTWVVKARLQAAT